MVIKVLPISWFVDNLPENQIVEEKMKEIIRNNYLLSGFIPLDTPIIERLEVLTSKWWDDNEIYWIHRINWEVWDDKALWLRFDLTVPLARYISQHEGELSFPFRRQHIGRSYRWERPQKWRFREFYQCDVDIIGNDNLPIFADVEVINTIYQALKELDFWDFVININNKKFLTWFLESIEIENIKDTISIIDKKDKVSKEKLKEMLESLKLKDKQIEEILKFIAYGSEKTNKEIFSFFSQINNNLLKTWLNELEELYNLLLVLWIEERYIKINPAISRGLNYYTGMVFETFIVWEEKLWSISSGGRYENLTSNFSKNNYPWVGGSIWLTRLIAILSSLWKIEAVKKSVTEVLVLNIDKDLLVKNLKIVEELRKNWISTEIYLDDKAKIQKQLKYADNKKIPFVIIMWWDEAKKWVVQVKNLNLGEQEEIKLAELVKYIKTREF